MTFVSPAQVIKSAGVERGMQVADFGCGPGFYSVPLAQAVGPSGRVYALDVQKEMLEMVRARAREARHLNIVPLRADLEKAGGSGLAPEVLDRVFIANVLFQAQDKKAVLSEAFRVLKSGGKLILVDWAGSAAGGPRPDMLLRRETAEKLLEETGFKKEREFYAGDNHYGLLYSKP